MPQWAAAHVRRQEGAIWPRTAARHGFGQDAVQCGWGRGWDTRMPALLGRRSAGVLHRASDHGGRGRRREREMPMWPAAGGQTHVSGLGAGVLGALRRRSGKLLHLRPRAEAPRERQSGRAGLSSPARRIATAPPSRGHRRPTIPVGCVGHHEACRWRCACGGQLFGPVALPV